MVSSLKMHGTLTMSGNTNFVIVVVTVRSLKMHDTLTVPGNTNFVIVSSIEMHGTLTVPGNTNFVIVVATVSSVKMHDTLTLSVRLTVPWDGAACSWPMKRSKWHRVRTRSTWAAGLDRHSSLRSWETRRPWISSDTPRSWAYT